MITNWIGRIEVLLPNLLVINITLSKDLRMDEKLVKGVNRLMIVLKILVFKTNSYHCGGDCVGICHWFI